MVHLTKVEKKIDKKSCLKLAPIIKVGENEKEGRRDEERSIECGRV